MSDDIVERLRALANTYGIVDMSVVVESAAEIERLRAALRTSHMQLALKMAGKSALSDEKHMSILQAALSPLPAQPSIYDGLVDPKRTRRVT